MKMKKATAVALAAAVAVGTLGFGVPAKASELVKTTDYTITIPATLDVKDKGWNGTAGITAKLKLGTGYMFDSEKKLTVTAESDNGWKLEAEGVTDTIGYNLAASGDTDSVYSAEAPATSWNFTAEEITTAGTNKGMGIIVDDYSEKPAGNYTDTVTFTAKVEDAAPQATSLNDTITAWTAGTYAVPASGLTYSDAITVSGDVTLVLTDGETLTLNKGISIANGATLTIQGNGTMNVNGSNENTSSTVAGTGTLVLASGTLNAKGGNGANGVRGTATDNRHGGNAINGNVTISGGTLKATGGNGGSVGNRTGSTYGANGGAAISGSVTITSGAVTATGGNGGSVGTSSNYSYGGNGGAAIGGDATISAGTWTAADGSNGINGSGQGGTGGKAVAGTFTDNR